MSYDAIRGHWAAVGLLREAVRGGRVGSGYLFSGPEGVGKALAARAFARAILCRDPREGGACEECPACVRSAAGSHPGLIEVEREESKARISIDQVKELERKLSLRPMEGETQVALLDEMELLGIEGYNALLKTLEEPPPRTTLLLVTANREFVPETIRSRCQGVRFGPLPRPAVAEILRASGTVRTEDAEALAALAGGSPGRAFRLAGFGYPGKARETEEILGRGEAGEEDPVAVAGAVFAALNPGKSVPKREAVREVLLLLTDRVRHAFLDPAAPGRDAPRADFCLRALTESLRDLSLNVNPDHVLRSACVRVLPVLGRREG